MFKQKIFKIRRRINQKSIGINNHKITLEALSNARIDIKNFDKEACDKSSYVLIKLKLNEDGKAEGNIEVENYLTCANILLGWINEIKDYYVVLILYLIY